MRQRPPPHALTIILRIYIIYPSGIHGSAHKGHQLIEKKTLFKKQFTEGIPVMKLDYHEHATKHFENLTRNYETTIEFLKNLKFNSCSSEYQAILGYLSYWSEND